MPYGKSGVKVTVFDYSPKMNNYKIVKLVDKKVNRVARSRDENPGFFALTEPYERATYTAPDKPRSLLFVITKQNPDFHFSHIKQFQ